MKFIDAAQVQTLLPMPECIDAMETAMTAVSKGDLSMPTRIIMPLVDNSAYFGVMPGSLAEPRVYGAKVISLHGSNPAKGLPAIQGFVALFDHDSGTPIAIIDGAAVTTLRTGAVSGLATRVLARPDASTLGLFGCGVQGGVHLDAMLAVRDIKEVRVWSRSPDKTRAFVAEHAARTGANIVAVDDPRVAADCDIICTTTASKEPVVRGEWVRPGTHVNLVGAHTPTAREADTALIAAGRVYIDSTASAKAEAGELIIPIGEGAIGEDHVIGELGSLLLGNVQGRTSDQDITIYKSLGIVAQDLVAAHAVYLRSNA